MTHTPFHCVSEERRRLVSAHGTLNGIDFVEVVDRDYAKPGLEAFRQRTLLIRCLKRVPAALNRTNVRVRGGVRVIDPRVEWARRADKTAQLQAEGRIGPVERAHLETLTEPDHVLVVRTAQAGDFSPYRIQLVAAPSEDHPPATFDRCLSEAKVFFRVECPSEFDCAEPAAPPIPDGKLPEIDYLARDFASLRRLLLDRLGITMPAWRESSLADVGHTLVDAFAYVGDYLSYRQDAVATEAYLGTARTRVSIRRHARLLDYHVHEGCNARAWVALEVDEGGGGDGLTLPAGTRFLTRFREGDAALGTSAVEEAERDGVQVFESMHAIMLHATKEPVTFHGWGADRPVIPKGAMSAALENRNGALDALVAGDVLVFEQARDPETGVTADADVAIRHAVRLTEVSLEPDELTGDALALVRWSDGDALPFPMPAHRVAGEPVTVVHRNVVLVDHGRTVRPGSPHADRYALPPVPEGGAPYRPMLGDVSITHCDSYPTARAHRQPSDFPASLALFQDARVALPVIGLVDNRARPWKRTRDLLAADRFAQEFVVEVEARDDRPEQREARLRFGDSSAGRAPPSGTRFESTLRVGNGGVGNVGAGSIAHVISGASGISSVRNPLAASGGRDPELAEDVRRYAPHAFRVRERAVTESDYAEVAERHPEVQKAVATRRWTGSWATMFVTVDRRGGKELTASFEDRLRAHMERYRLAGHDIEIDGPQFVALEIAMTICVEADHLGSDVKAALLEAFSSHQRADGSQGFFHPDRFTFGQPVFLSDVIAHAMSVPGVAWIDLDEATPERRNRFRRYGEESRGEHDEGRMDMGRLEIARLRNDPSAPENGVIRFDVVGESA